MAVIQAAGFIAPAGPGIAFGIIPGGAVPAPGAKADIHLPIISMNSGSAAVAAIWSRHRSWNRLARSSRSAAASLPEFFALLIAGEV